MGASPAGNIFPLLLINIILKVYHLAGKALVSSHIFSQRRGIFCPYRNFPNLSPNFQLNKFHKIGIIGADCSLKPYRRAVMTVALPLPSPVSGTRGNFLTDFDQEARDWDANPAKVARANAIAGAIRSRVTLQPWFSAFEYGCGTGLLSFALQPYVARITLADSSPGMLGVLKEKIAANGIRNMTPVRLDLCADPLPAERYNLIYTLMTLHHIPDTKRILTDFHALLAQGGYLCIADLDKEDGSYHGADFSGHAGFDRRELQEEAEQAGFRAIRWETVYTMTRETAHSRKTYPLFLLVAEKG
jgi:SAM-dependent methyltransferase